MNEYNFQKIESKWQKHWSENNSIKCDINAKEKIFIIYVCIHILLEICTWGILETIQSAT